MLCWCAYTRPHPSLLCLLAAPRTMLTSCAKVRYGAHFSLPDGLLDQCLGKIGLQEVGNSHVELRQTSRTSRTKWSFRSHSVEFLHLVVFFVQPLLRSQWKIQEAQIFACAEFVLLNVFAEVPPSHQSCRRHRHHSCTCPLPPCAVQVCQRLLNRNARRAQRKGSRQRFLKASPSL